MKRGKWANIRKIAMLTALAMASLTACGEEGTVDYSIEGITEEPQQPQREGGRSDLAQFAGEEVWKETWETKVGVFYWNGEPSNVVGDMKVDARIIVPQTKQMSVVEVTEPKFDAEFKETVAENIFESGEIYYGDPVHLPKRDLQEVKNYFDEVGEITIRYESYPYSIRQLKRRLEAMQAAVTNMENARETYIPVEEYTVNEYFGIYKEQMYRLSFAERPDDGLKDTEQMKCIMLEPKDLYEVCPEKFKEQENLTCSPWMQGNWVENQCEISEEDALAEAKTFVEQMGLDYPVYSFSYPLLWGNPSQYVTEESASEDWGVDGYVFVFDLGVDDISFVNYGTEEDYDFFGNREGETDSAREIRYSHKARMEIYVTDRGVIKVIANNPQEMISVTEGVKLLSLDTIKSTIKVQVEEQWDLLNLDGWGSDKYFDTMELIYFRIGDKENPGKYSYVPVWRLGTVTRDPVTYGISIYEPVLINAIDGSLIDFFEET